MIDDTGAAEHICGGTGQVTGQVSIEQNLEINRFSSIFPVDSRFACCIYFGAR
jgi:hypothetical protein